MSHTELETINLILMCNNLKTIVLMISCSYIFLCMYNRVCVCISAGIVYHWKLILELTNVNNFRESCSIYEQLMNNLRY